ncbi:hypothetical protein LTR17_027823, partial [Elasticomyces elasticus]
MNLRDDGRAALMVDVVQLKLITLTLRAVMRRVLAQGYFVGGISSGGAEVLREDAGAEHDGGGKDG